MARFDTDEIGKPGKLPKVRRFPWRLWLYAIAITGAAGAVGYYGWQYRGDAHANAEARNKAIEDGKACTTGLAKAQTQVSAAEKKATECVGSLQAQVDKTKDLE